MIKAIGKDGRGNPLVIIGLTEENWRRLRTGGDEGLGRPMSFDLSELGLPPTMIMIVADSTNETIEASLRRFGLLS